jgi:two-component system response regulator YesN
MSYRILIVDDEEDIREGLTDLVDWSSLGFEVVARLEDGRDAITYIQSHSVDVILTDIKMTFVSGLELAKYVYDHQYSIKMILLSGYKEFEFAQLAVNYKVAHYLLKPTKLEEMNAVFREMKALLDKEHSDKVQSNEIQIRNEEMASVLRQQFFSELTAGTLKEREEMVRRLELIGLHIDPDNSPCCLYFIHIPHQNPGLHPNAANQPNQIIKFIQQAHKNEHEEILYTPLRSTEDKIYMIAAAVGHVKNEYAFKEKISVHFDVIKGKVRAILGIDATLEEMQFYPQLSQLIPLEDSLHSSDTLVIQKAKLYIQKMYDKEISLDDVAEHVYLSPVYFSRMFKKQTGRNLTDYITEMRMIKAMELLRQPEYKVYEIGSIIGYKSTKYFFKLFKQYANCTPTEYRNKLQYESPL